MLDQGRLVDGGDDRGGTFCVIWGRNKVEISKTRWWFQIFLIFTLNPGEMIQFDEHIFLMADSTTTQRTYIYKHI